MEANGCDNVSVERLSSEDFSSAFEGKGTAAVRLSNGTTLADYDLHTLLVDPPRAGMDERTCHVATTFKRVVYISCNPETMVRRHSYRWHRGLHSSQDAGDIVADRCATSNGWWTT